MFLEIADVCDIADLFFWFYRACEGDRAVAVTEFCPVGVV